MALAVDIMHEHGPSYKVRHQLQPKKTKVRLYLLLMLQQKVAYVLYITNKIERNRYIVRVAKHLKED